MFFKKYFYAILCGFLFLSGIPKIHSQEKKHLKIESKNSYAEKIYLQPVSTVFTTDKTIWFKAIVTDLEHVPTKLSAVLHVELIDFDKRVIDEKLLKIENGITDGYFDLNEELPPGRYLIRAYTEWNHNFDIEFISQTYIDIYAPEKVLASNEAIRNITLQETADQQYELSANVYPQLLSPKYKGELTIYVHTDATTDFIEVEKNKDDSYLFRYLLPKNAVRARMELKLDSVKERNFNYKQIRTYSKTVAINKEYLDVQFFPEGGKLVDGITSSVAFKILDYNNKGKQITGSIMDESDKIINTFKSNTMGMGTIDLTPNIKKTYYAIVKGKDGIEYKYPLPSINPTGIVLHIKEIQEFIVIGLKTKETTENIFQVKVQARGVEYDDFYLQFKNGSASTGIEKSKLPEGIIKFTVTNKANQIVGERLFFNYKEEERIYIDVALNSQKYKQRDKTVINIITEDEDVNAIKTNLSVLVINKEQLGEANNLRSNILSYFLLNSELRGNIEQPNYYFNKENKNRKKDLDALLLSQGWSNYKYEKDEFNTDFEFLPETALTVSGTIKEQWFSKRGLRNPVDLTIVYDPLNVSTQQIDSTGRFKFYLEDSYENKFRAMLQTKNKRGKNKDFILDLDKHESPSINYKKDETVQFAGNIYVKENIKRKQIEDDFKVADGTVELEEVELTGYTMTPQRQKIKDLHGLPDIVIENEELLSKQKKWHYGLFSLLKFSFPDVFDTDYAEMTYYLVDGILVSRPDDIKYLKSASVEDIKSFELLKKPDNPKYYMNQGPTYDIDATQEQRNQQDMATLNARVSIISIYTYAGKGLNYLQSPKGIHKFSVQGFSAKTEFYAPKYDDVSGNEWNIPDLRSVVHWSPNVNTDENGKVQVEFYNADNTGEMLILVEGITEDGKIGYSEISYTVEEK